MKGLTERWGKGGLKMVSEAAERIHFEGWKVVFSRVQTWRPDRLLLTDKNLRKELNKIRRSSFSHWKLGTRTEHKWFLSRTSSSRFQSWRGDILKIILDFLYFGPYHFFRYFSFVLFLFLPPPPPYLPPFPWANSSPPSLSLFKWILLNSNVLELLADSSFLFFFSFFLRLLKTSKSS